MKKDTIALSLGRKKIAPPSPAARFLREGQLQLNAYGAAALQTASGGAE